MVIGVSETVSDEKSYTESLQKDPWGGNAMATVTLCELYPPHRKLRVNDTRLHAELGGILLDSV